MSETTNGLARPEPTVLCLAAQAALDRQAYRVLLRQELGLDFQIECSFAPVSIWDALRADPHVVLVVSDTVSPELRDAVQMIPRLKKRARLLALSAAPESGALTAWGDCPLHGFVLKSQAIEELGEAVQALLAGGRYFTPAVKQFFNAAKERKTASATLSRRESELLPLLARGMTLREAATRMTVSYKTADSYRTSLLRKLGIHDRVELARYAIRERIIEA